MEPSERLAACEVKIEALCQAQKRYDNLAGALRRLERDYLDSRLESIETATNLSRESIERRLDGIEDSIESLQESAAQAKGKASQQSVIWAYIMTLVSMAIAAAALMLGLLDYLTRS